jgi:hypothetical protein
VALTRADLHPAEEQLWDLGGVLRPNSDTDSRTPVSGRLIRAELITQLLMDNVNRPDSASQIIWIESATIEGDLDLNTAKTGRGLCLINCEVPGNINLYSAEIPTFVINGGALRGRLYGDMSHVTSTMSLSGARFDGLVSLNASNIDGVLNLRKSEFASPVHLQSTHCRFIDCTASRFP